MTSAIIVAAGRGTRMGAGVDKLWLEVAGKPVIAHTWGRYDRCPAVEEIVLVVRDGAQPDFAELARHHGFQKPWRCAPGGAERQDSVWNGLSALSPDCDLVAIHDGARPCTDPALILATLAAAGEVGAAVAAQAVTDTIKEGGPDGLVIRTLDRSRLWSVQTPQAFRTATIRSALAEVRRRGLQITDDTAACELIGQPVRLVTSPVPNPKVTRPEDLPWIEWLLRPTAPSPACQAGPPPLP